LQTIEGLEKCLVAPWTKQQLEKEMAKVSQVPALSGRNKQGEETIESGGSGELKLDEHIKEYLSMLSRGRTSKSSSLKEPRTKISIEGSLKLSQSIKFPAQSAASTRDPPIPQWFANAREISKEDDTASEYSSLQSVASLNQVYGLSIMLGSDIALATPEDIAISEGIYLRDEELKVRMKDDDAKTIDAAASGEWGSECILDPSLNTTTSLVGKLKALDVPTLSPRLGVAFAGGSGKENLSKGMGEWRPKIETMICTTSPIGGHAGPVSRLAVSHDQRFFVSGSYDSTCKVWELGKIGTSAGVMESATSYSGHASNKAAMNVRVNDIVILESSHSVASASSDGRVHVWRVDLVSGSQPLSVTGAENTRVSGCSVVKTVESTDEGEVLAVSHFNSLSASVLAFATQRGIVHSWDLRADKEPFVLKHPAELGYLTSMAIGTDRNWVVAGTSRGYIALWDIRWRTMTKLWKHSSAQPINRLATTYAVIPSSRASSDPRPLVFVASGNECGMFDVTDGVCRQGFRVVCPQEAFGTCRQRAVSTSLKEIDISGRNAHRQLRRDELVPAGSPRSGPQMYAMVGSIGGYDQNYLITGGDDAHIRYWDFSSPSKCYAVSGQIGSHQRPSYERFDIQPYTRLMVCRQSAGLRLQDVESSRVPRRLQRGLVRAESRHHDAILDLKLIQSPVKAVVSCSRDGSISVFK
jgi:phosphoinositide-3-kinase regulatory subunit 4